MNNIFEGIWSGFSASIPGSGHIQHGLPCQDASAVALSPRPALIVCDGRGSASRSQDGANGAVSAFATQCAVFEPMLASILDADAAAPERWQMFCRILYRTLRQVQVELAAKHGIPEKEFDFTVAAAIVGTNWIGCFQVGDGSIVLRQNGIPVTAFPPDKGEFANQTHFLRENGEATGRFHGEIFSAHANSGIAITSDGPEHLMFRLKDMMPGPIFSRLFDDLGSGNLSKQDIMDYLTRREWDNDPRGRDDRSLAILAPVCPEATVENKTEQAVAFEQDAKPESDTEPQLQATMKDDSVDTETAATFQAETNAAPRELPVQETGPASATETQAKEGNWTAQKTEEHIPLKITCAVLALALLGGFAYHAMTVEKQDQVIRNLSSRCEKLGIETNNLRSEKNALKESLSELEQSHRELEVLREKLQGLATPQKGNVEEIQKGQARAVNHGSFSETEETSHAKAVFLYIPQGAPFTQKEQDDPDDGYLPKEY